jgi:hypothetical protein
MAGTTQHWSYSVMDNSAKQKNSGMFIGDLIGDMAGNILYTDITDLESTLADLTLGNVVKSVITVPYTTGLAVPPVGVNIQNEIYLRVVTQDTTTLKFGSFTIPAADPALRRVNTDLVETTDSRWVDAVAIWESAGRSDIGNAIRIIGGSFEGGPN